MFCGLGEEERTKFRKKNEKKKGKKRKKKEKIIEKTLLQPKVDWEG